MGLVPPGAGDFLMKDFLTLLLKFLLWEKAQGYHQDLLLQLYFNSSGRLGVM